MNPHDDLDEVALYVLLAEGLDVPTAVEANGGLPRVRRSCDVDAQIDAANHADAGHSSRPFTFVFVAGVLGPALMPGRRARWHAVAFGLPGINVGPNIKRRGVNAPAFDSPLATRFDIQGHLEDVWIPVNHACT